MQQDSSAWRQSPAPSAAGKASPSSAFASFRLGASRFFQPKPLSPAEKKQANAELNILPDASVDSFVSYLKDHNCRKIVVMTGAGISTAAGIPDFRSPDTGLYANLAKYNLPYPEAVFSINYFRKSPKPFFTLAKELYPGCFRPTLSHYFIRVLAEEGMLLRCYTQNIDTLERVAGISDSHIVEAHGSFASARCVGRHPRIAESSGEETAWSDNESDDSDYAAIQESDYRACGREYSQEWVKDHVFNDKVPECTYCQGIVKPNITFFGESLPNRFHAMAGADLAVADALIVIGTSLKVHPFAGLINKVQPNVPRLLINMEVVGEEGSPHRGFDFTGEVQEYRRDALFLGSADAGCEKLAEMLGLSEKLHALMTDEHAKIDLAASLVVDGVEVATIVDEGAKVVDDADVAEKVTTEVEVAEIEDALRSVKL
ncbi:NAD-dependent protein deacetylase sirtuin-2 [Entophlyctis luteolus]|nr:NAD-dependent protein deacetylase sirtuin-2 [Entophlyctis luteolus]